MWHYFRYYQYSPVDHGRAFPGAGSSAMRPILRVMLRSAESEEERLAMVDSGADYCLFPLYLTTGLGLLMKDSTPVSGIVGFGLDGSEDVPFWSLALDIGSGASVVTRVGFTEKLNEYEIGVLGQLGSFSEVEQVTFNYQKGSFGIYTIDPVAQGAETLK